MSKVNIFENLFAGDLQNMVQPVISIDDFESKIDDKTLVIAFYTKNQEAADDMSVFLERSRYDFVLDTETSSSVNKDGDYLVFIELDAKDVTNGEMAERVMEMARLVTVLSDIKLWRIKNNRVLGNETQALTKKNVSLLFKMIKEYTTK